MIAKIHKASKKDINFAHEFYKKQGKNRNMRFFRLVYCPNPTKTLKFSVIISKKVANSAVLRNKIKRQVYDAVKNAGFGNFADGTYIFNCVKGVEKAQYAEIALEIKGLLE